jgi:hypothetical protein
MGRAGVLVLEKSGRSGTGRGGGFGGGGACSVAEVVIEQHLKRVEHVYVQILAGPEVDVRTKRQRVVLLDSLALPCQRYGIRTFDSAPRAVAIENPAVMVANCAHPALIVLGPGGL